MIHVFDSVLGVHDFPHNLVSLRVPSRALVMQHIF